MCNRAINDSFSCRHGGTVLKCLWVLVWLGIFSSCGSWRGETKPTIEFTKVPVADTGGAVNLDTIAGRVTGNRPGQRIVIFAYSRMWWSQPFVSNPLTDIRPDSTWENQTHLGTKYAAILVEAGYRPPETITDLPAVGGPVIAVVVVDGVPPENPIQPKIVQFSGYDWQVRGGKIDGFGARIARDPSNVWVDDKGFLHLRISKIGDDWGGIEIALTRSLGYGTYKFTVRDTAQLEPAAYFAMLTYDDRESGEHNREMDIEICRWGGPTKTNLHYVLQPYYIPVNVASFSLPAGPVTNILVWNAGLAELKTVRGAGNDRNAQILAEHKFSSGIPTPGEEMVHLCLFAFPNAKIPLQRENEIVVEKFEFLP